MRMLTPDRVAAVLATGDPARVEESIPPKFHVGDLVRVVELNKITHNRLPGYIRDKVGKVTAAHGVFVFPDTSAHRQGLKPQHVYTVMFTAKDLWGEIGHAADRIHVDVWDDYITRA